MATVGIVFVLLALCHLCECGYGPSGFSDDIDPDWQASHSTGDSVIRTVWSLPAFIGVLFVFFLFEWVLDRIATQRGEKAKIHFAVSLIWFHAHGLLHRA